MSNISNAKLEENGDLTITLDSGNVVITKEQLAKNVYLGQPVEYNGANKVLQIRDDKNENVLFAYDTNTGELLDASKYIHDDEYSPEEFIQVENLNAAKAVLEKERMFLVPFDPENTYFPSDRSKIFRDYDTEKSYPNEGEFNFYYVFGKLPEGMDSPFRMVNFIKIPRDPSVIASTDTYIISEQVYNVDDGTFSTIHFMTGGGDEIVPFIQESISDDKFLLPRFKLTNEMLAHPFYRVLRDYLKENNLLEQNGEIPKVKELVLEWFETGHVPKELESILNDFIYIYIREE